MARLGYAVRSSCDQSMSYLRTVSAAVGLLGLLFAVVATEVLFI
jgi:hypothetical protein